MLRFPRAMEINTFSRGRVEMLKFRIESGSILEDCSLLEFRERMHCEVLVCAVERLSLIHI